MNNFLLKKTATRLFCAICVIITISCSKQDNAPVGQLRGKTLYSGTTISVPGVTIEINEISTISSEYGIFIIEDLPIGKHQLEASINGFDTFISEVSISTTSTNLDIQMTSEIFTSSLYGQALGDRSGNPIPDIQVVIMNPGGSESDLTTITDTKGNYYLSYIPQGDRTLIVKTGEKEILRFQFNLSVYDYQYDIMIPEPGVPFEFEDSRDSHKYLACGIGTQTWMIENLAYLPVINDSHNGSIESPYYYVYSYEGSSVSEAKATDYYQEHGVIYNWTSALNACPPEWHLPTDEDWKILEKHLGMSSSQTDYEGDVYRTSGSVGFKLKSETGWSTENNGDNSSGFNAFPAYGRMHYGGWYLPTSLTMWTATTFNSSFAWYRGISTKSDGLTRRISDKGYGNYIRCVKD